MSAANTRALNEFEKRFAKAYGADALKRGDEIMPYEVVSTGSILLDVAMGIGGVCEGKLTEFWGPDGIGKSTVALLTAANAQDKYPDKQVGWVDMEESLDPPWTEAHGVDRNRLSVFHPRNSEEVADAMKDMVTSGLFSLVVLDSIGGMIPKVEIEKQADEEVVGKGAKVVTRMVKILSSAAARHGVGVILCNQQRANIGGYGSDVDRPGGHALKHHTVQRLKFRNAGSPKTVKRDGDEVQVAKEIAVKVERSRVCSPGRIAKLLLVNEATEKYGDIGIDKADEAFQVGVRLGLIDRAGAYYTLPVTGERTQGEDKTLDALRDSPEVIEHIRTKAIESLAEDVHDDDDEADAEPEFRMSSDENR